MRDLRSYVAIAVMLSLAACATPAVPAASQITRVVSTTSFGMCLGYCSTRLEITEGQAVLIREARGGRGAPRDLPEQRYTTPLTAAEWQDIQRLSASVDFEVLPETIGCPDCADGGAEGLTVAGPSGAESVSLEFGASVPQAQPLLNRVRAIRDRLTPAQ
ncbi:MAG: hypothetical protein R3C27_09465 [Hyphomonadaceae bacterium]